MKPDGSVDMAKAEFHNLTLDNLRDMGFVLPWHIDSTEYEKFIKNKKEENETLIKNNTGVYKI